MLNLHLLSTFASRNQDAPTQLLKFLKIHQFEYIFCQSNQDSSGFPVQSRAGWQESELCILGNSRYEELFQTEEK